MHGSPLGGKWNMKQVLMSRKGVPALLMDNGSIFDSEASLQALTQGQKGKKSKKSCKSRKVDVRLVTVFRTTPKEVTIVVDAQVVLPERIRL